MISKIEKAFSDLEKARVLDQGKSIFEFEDSFFSEWLEESVAYGAFEDGKLLGFVEGTIEVWNNRYRISNICVFDNEKRHSGVGSKLMGMKLYK